MELLQSVGFWIGLFKIVWINIILSGDNAVVIALVIFGSTLMIKLMARFPVIVTLGAALGDGLVLFLGRVLQRRNAEASQATSMQ